MCVKLGWLLLLCTAGLASGTAWAQNNPVPFINNPLVPTAVAPGGPGFTLTVNGTGFVSGATVNWNGKPLASTFVSQGQLTATVPASNIATIGSASITVVNPAPGGGASASVLFSVPPTMETTFAEAPGSPFPVQSAFTLAAAADFNGDGKLDLALAGGGGGDNNVIVLLGNGDGTFTRSVSSPGPKPGDCAVAMAVGDFNSDGKQDLAFADICAADVVILLGNGDGTFTTTPLSPATGQGPVGIATGDFNRDGNLDLAVANNGDGTLTILLGNGDGTFSPSSASPTTEPEPISVAVGDFNGDGKLDLVVPCDYDNKVDWEFGNGDGTFTRALHSLNTGSLPWSVVVGDFNGDGNLDFAVLNTNSNDITVLLGNGDGTFTPSSASPTTGTDARTIVEGDFNGDGKLDLAVASDLNHGVTVLLGRGDGTFTQTTAPTDYGQQTIVVGDFDGDGTVDLATTMFYSSKASVLLQVPAVRLSVSSLAFADQTLGTTSLPQIVSLINQGTTPLSVTSISSSGNFMAQTVGTTCSTSSPLGVGGHCAIGVAFAPTTLGSATGSLIVNDDAIGSPQTAALLGTGVNPTASLSPVTLVFGNQGIGAPSAAQTVTLTNSGAGPLTVDSVAADDDFVATNNCGGTVAQGAQCSVSVTFDPSDAGTRFGTLTITDNAADSPQTVSLSGTGVPPTVAVSPASLTFGNQLVHTTSAAQTVTLTNNGPGPLTVTGVAATGEFSVASSNCPGTVAASTSCTISVTFTPSANGARSGALTITDNAVGSSQTAGLAGTGLGPVASLSPSSLSFQNQMLGTTSLPQTVTLANTGGATMTLSSIAATNPFAETTDCTATLSAGASCHIQVTFTPATNGSATGSVTVNTDGGGASTNLTGTGAEFSLSLSPATATIAPGAAATFTINVSAASGFTQPIALACSGAPALSTCTVSPPSVTPGAASPAAALLFFSTTAPSEAAPRGPFDLPPWGGLPVRKLWIVLIEMAIASLAMASGRRRVAIEGPPTEGLALSGMNPSYRMRVRLALIAALLGCILAASCGGGGGPVLKSPGTPAGTYTLTLTGTSDGLSTSAALTVTLQP